MRAAALALAACAGCAGAPELPEGTGKGLLAWTRQPPAGAQTYERPDLLPGDWFVYRKAGQIRVQVRVASADADGYRFVEDSSGLITRYDRDLGVISEALPAAAVAAGEAPGVPAVQKRNDPVDPEFHWPLWVGKEWTTEILEKRLGRDAVPLRVQFLVEGLDTVRLPAGTFQALRIRRRSTPVRPGRFTSWTTLSWYAPEVGFIVRRLDGGHEVELIEYQRQ